MAPQRMETPPPIITIPSTTTATKSWSRNMHHTRDISISSLPQQQQPENNDSPCRIEDGYYIFEDDNSLPATTATAKVTVLSVDLEEEASPIQHQQQQYCCICFPIPRILYTFCYWYSTQMDTHPVSTKSITGGCSSILGDVIAQFVETPYANYWGIPLFNYRRTFAMFCTGLCLGPILHYTYEFYEYVLPINIDAGCVGTVVTPMRECAINIGSSNGSRMTIKSYCPYGGVDGTTVKCGGEGFPSQTMSTNDMLLLADGTRIMKHDKQLSSSNTTNNHHHDNNQHVERRNNNDDNDFSIRSNNTLVEEIVDSTTTTTTTHNHQETTTYFCHSTMFHSYYTISRRSKLINAILHVVIDQGIMGFVFIALMMLISGIIEGHWDTLRTIFVNDYITNIHLLWLVALFGIGPIQILAFRYLSLKWRALSVSCLDVLEVTIMSVITHRNI